MGKFQAGQAQIGGKYGGSGHGDPGQDPDVDAVHLLQAVQAASGADDQPPPPGISSQHIGTGAQNGRLQLPSMGPAEKAGQLLHTAGEGHHLTGTADPKGSMLGQRLLHPQLRLREGRLNCLL